MDTFTWYCRPFGTDAIVKSPDVLLVTLRWDLFSRFVSTTVACGTRAPLASRTTPLTVPVVTCAAAREGKSSRQNSHKQSQTLTEANFADFVIATTSRLSTPCGGAHLDNDHKELRSTLV